MATGREAVRDGRVNEPQPKRTLYVSSYLPAILRGMLISMRHFFSKPVTIQYPEKRPEINKRFRGEHWLKKDEKGHIKCVACYMCSTACPANCIHIEAQPTPDEPGWEGRDKIPKGFEIDMLRCIYCGYCVEACPKDAIGMTNKIPKVHTNRKEYIYDMEKLLSNNDPEK